MIKRKLFSILNVGLNEYKMERTESFYLLAFVEFILKVDDSSG